MNAIKTVMDQIHGNEEVSFAPFGMHVNITLKNVDTGKSWTSTLPNDHHMNDDRVFDCIRFMRKKNLSSKTILKEMLAECTDDNRKMFMRMYSHDSLDASINEAVDKMHDEKVNHANVQLQNTLNKNQKKQI